MTKYYYKYPFEINHVDSETNKKLLNDFKGEKTGFVQIGSKKYFFPNKFAEEADKYYNVEVRSNDVWIVSFPRSGTTMTQELAWLIGNDLDYETAAKVLLEKRFPFFEFGAVFHDDVKQELLDANAHSDFNLNFIDYISKPGWEILPDMNSPRFIKTHIPFSLLPKGWHSEGCKTIYIARNPKDVAVSFYHLSKLFRTLDFQADFEQFWEYFEKNLVPWASYWSHIEEALARKNQQNILFLLYEDVVSDMPNSIRKIASFLGKSLNEKQINTLKEHMSFENFRKNNSVNAQLYNELKITVPSKQGFIRQGKINQNNNELNSKLNQRINRWVEENLKNMNISSPKIN